MRYSKEIPVLVWAIAFVLWGFGLPKNIQKKLEKEISKTFEVEQFTMESVTVSEALNTELPTTITEQNLFRLLEGDQTIGYAFVDQAPSKTAAFDYLVLFDPNLSIVNSKVLVYREEYGGEIGSTRWLRQFQGKSVTDRVSTDTNIDAISGATISVRSMTRSVDNLLQTMRKLQENQLL